MIDHLIKFIEISISFSYVIGILINDLLAAIRIPRNESLDSLSVGRLLESLRLTGLNRI